jgi:hypothetical protein
MTGIPTFTPVPVVIAGRLVSDAAGSVITYLDGARRNTSQRVLDYDLAAWERRESFNSGLSTRRISRESIVSANRLRGRLRHSQLVNWYEPQELTTRWDLVTPADTFVGADPKICGGTYDNLCAIWYNFRPTHVLGHAQFCVGATQVNKVLHQVLPNLVPIFDDKLRKLYFQGPFRATSLSICDVVTRGRLTLDCASLFGDGFEWEPLRLDMAAISPGQFREIRRQIATRPSANALLLRGLRANVWASTNLSDIRIFDMIAWQL